MSLSQKHSGKALVPWYNDTEWLFVYDCLRKNDRQNLEIASNIMKIWKQRVPFLSAGVAGTLILLDGILNNDDSKSEIYAVTLLRFLNLCVANNVRQGYFTKTAEKGDIPKWLIEIRHDIAHSDKLPSKTMLELSLQKALDWVMNKYWKAQHDIVKDYVINEENERLEELLTAYVRLKVNKFGGKSTHDFDAALSRKIKYFLGKHGQSTSMRGVIEVLEEMLRQSLKNDVACKIMSRILVQKNALLYSVDKDFTKIWNNLLNIIFEKKMLIPLLFKLCFTTDEAEWNDVEKKRAAVWVNAIFQGLLNLKNENGSKYDNILFNKKELLQDFNSKLLLETVISSPNDYTLIYLKNLMKFNEQTEDYITKVSNLIKNATIPSNNQHLQENLDVTFELGEEFKKIEKITSTATEIVDNDILSNDEMHWTPITDKESFTGCPLGVLPYQIRNKNPSLLV